MCSNLPCHNTAAESHSSTQCARMHIDSSVQGCAQSRCANGVDWQGEEADLWVHTNKVDAFSGEIFFATVAERQLVFAFRIPLRWLAKEKDLVEATSGIGFEEIIQYLQSHMHASCRQK